MAKTSRFSQDPFDLLGDVFYGLKRVKPTHCAAETVTSISVFLFHIVAKDFHSHPNVKESNGSIHTDPDTRNQELSF